MKVSIIIRTKNEAKRIGEVLEVLSTQTEKDFEVVIIDSGSTDKTLEIAKEYSQKVNIKIFTISPEQFTYPLACNFGAEKSTGKYLVYISGHSIPIGKNWLTDGLKNFKDEKVAGVYGSVMPSKDASFTEFFGYFGGYFSLRKIITKPILGILGNTNSIIIRELWQKHHFDEKYIEGGEDGEMACYLLTKGYKIIKDPKFAVYHSHSFGLTRYIKQNIHWHKVANKFRSQYRDL